MILQIADVSYSFLSLLPAKESLVVRGPRLHDTPFQRQNKVYAPDVVVKVEVEDASQRLSAEFFDDNRLVLYHGERKQMRIWLSNVGTQAIGDIWLVGGQEDVFWVEESGDQGAGARFTSPFSPLRCLRVHSRSLSACLRDLSFRQFFATPNTLQDTLPFHRKSITFTGCQLRSPVCAPRKQTRRAGTLPIVHFSGGTRCHSGYHQFLQLNTTRLGRRPCISLCPIGTVFRSSPPTLCDTDIWAWTKIGKPLYFVLRGPEHLRLDVGYRVPGGHAESDMVVQSPH
jgi:hypothetical protein